MIETRIGICRIGGDSKSFASWRKRLARGEEFFLGKVSASRRTCAHNYASMLGWSVGTWRSGTHRGRSRREVRVCGVSPNITKGTANAVPFVMLVETTRLELVTSTMST